MNSSHPKVRCVVGGLTAGLAKRVSMEVSRHIIFHQLSNLEYLAINALSGAVDIVDKHIYRFLCEYPAIRLEDIDPSLVERLKRRGYLVDDCAAESTALLRFESIFSQRQKRLSFVVCPTYDCNLRCSYCFEGSLPHDKPLYMGMTDIDNLFAAIDELRSTHADRKASIELFGGEPLMESTVEFVESLLVEASHRSLPISIATNGVNAALFRPTLKKHAGSIRSIQITLDGPAEIHDKRRKSRVGRGSFAESCSTIDMLLDIGIRVVLRTNVDAQNINDISSLLRFMKDKGWTEHDNFVCNLSPVQDHALTGRYKHFLTEDVLVDKIFRLFKTDPEVESTFKLNMFRTLSHIRSVIEGGRPVPPLLHYCEANNLENLVFGPDGLIYTCTECMGQPELAVGRFRPDLKLDNSKLEIWNNRSVLRMEKCRDCGIVLLCGGGCAYSALVVNGDIDKPVCNRAHETISTYLNCIADSKFLESKV